MLRSFQLSGHRGARALWPENTLAGFSGALALGVDAVELDVVLTADDVAVVTHDLTLNPDLARDPHGRWIAAPGPAVRHMTFAELALYDVGRVRPGSTTAHAHPRQQPADGERVPTLAAVLRLLQPHAVRIELELKIDPARPHISSDPDRLAALAVAEVTAAGLAARTTVRSFDWRGLAAVAARQPELRLCFLTKAADSDALARTVAAAAGRAADWAPAFAHLTPDRIAAARGAGLRVLPWTVNDSADMTQLIAWGVDGFCTDAPDLARALLPVA